MLMMKIAPQAAVAVIRDADEGSRLLQTFPVRRRLLARLWNGDGFEPPESVLALDDDDSPIEVGAAAVLAREGPDRAWRVVRRESLSLSGA